jgi:hypothetical protein
MLCRKRDNEIAVIGDKGISDADDRAATVARPRRKGALDIGITWLDSRPIAIGIATCVLTLAARNTPSGSPRFLALPVLTLPFNGTKSCLLRRRPPTFDDEARAVRAIASVSLSVAHSLGHERDGYRANAEPQSKLFYS